MARTDIAISAVSPAKLITTVNAALLPYTQHAIVSVVFAIGDNATYNGEYKVIITLDDGAGTAIAPFFINIFDSGTWALAVDAMQAYRAVNPTYFISTPFAGYLVGETGRVKRNPVLVVANTDSSAGSRFLAGGGSGAVSGPAGGDLSGSYPNPTVVRIQSVPISAPVSGGAGPIYDSATGQIVWYAPLVYPDLAAAAADQANQYVGVTITVYNPPGGPEDGTYRVAALTGNPSDYTKISDATNTASEVSIVDAGGYYTSTDVEGALQEIGAELAAGVPPTGAAGGDLSGTYPSPDVAGIQGLLISGSAAYEGDALAYNAAGPGYVWIPGAWVKNVTLPSGTPTQVDSLLVDRYGAAVWEIVLENQTTGEREVWNVRAAHNGTASADATGTPSFTVAGLDGNLATLATFTATLSGAGATQTFNLLVTVTGTSWRAAVRRTPLNPL